MNCRCWAATVFAFQFSLTLALIQFLSPRLPKLHSVARLPPTREMLRSPPTAVSGMRLGMSCSNYFSAWFPWVATNPHQNAFSQIASWLFWHSVSFCRNYTYYILGRYPIFDSIFLGVCRSYIVFCNSGLRWSAYSSCVLQFRVALVCVFLLCFAIQVCAGLRILIMVCNSGLRRSQLNQHTQKIDHISMDDEHAITELNLTESLVTKSHTNAKNETNNQTY